MCTVYTVIKDAKRKGTRIEHKIIQQLTKDGYACTRAAGSLGMWDIIAIRKDAVKLIQAKANRWPGIPEMETLIAFKAPSSVSKEVWRWNDFARSAQVRYLEP